MNYRRCKIHYRRLNRVNGRFPDFTLARALVQAFESKLESGQIVGAKPTNRMWSVSEGNDLRRFINHFHKETGQDLIFGTVCQYSPGEMQALLELDVEEKHRSLDEVMRAINIAEQRAPSGKEYLHGITYLMIIRDHFYQIQHTSLQTPVIEEYFTWLLREHTTTIGAKQFVELQVEFDRAQIGDLSDVKEIEIGGFVTETIRDQPQIPSPGGKMVESETRESLGERVAHSFQSARQILVDLLGDVEAQKLIDSVPIEAALEVKVSIGYRAQRRKIQKEFMSNLASGLRHLPDGQILIRGRDGEIKGNDARLNGDMNVKRMNEASGLLDLEDTQRQMMELHRRFLHDGRIIT